MKLGLTDTTLLLNRSMSMDTVKSDVLIGINNFITDQKSAVEECNFTLVQFDSKNPQDVTQDAVAVKDAAALAVDTFVPKGWTPLLDAIGTAIDRTAQRLAGTPDDLKPEKVVFVIITDSAENASSGFTRDQIFKKVKQRANVDGWKFLYLGANHDAISAARDIGISPASAATYTLDNMVTLCSAMSSNLKAFRSGAVSTVEFSPKQRKDVTQGPSVIGLDVIK